MATPNRTAILARLQKTLKKQYKPVEVASRPVLEQLLFGCLYENAHLTPAEEGFKTLQSTFFDWNEVRVSMIKELGEVLHKLPDAQAAATRLKRVLQSVFEATYSFDMESLKKQNLGASIKRLEKLEGIDPFLIGHVVLHVLGGHAIPLDQGALDVAWIIGMITDAEREKGVIPGLERAVPKNRGREFASLLHQFGADLVASPYSPEVHKLLLEIAPDCKDRLPKRLTKKQKEAAEAEAAAKAAAERAARRAEMTRQLEALKKPAEQPKTAAAAAKRPPAPAAKPEAKKEAPPARRPEAKAAPPAKSAAAAPKPPAAKPKESAAKHKETPKPKSAAPKPKDAPAKNKPAPSSLGKRKPR